MNNKKKFINSLQVRVCPLPLLRSYCHIKNENNPLKDALRIFHYVYGNGYIERNCIQTLLKGSQKLEIYSNEFEYLWDISINIKEYLKICNDITSVTPPPEITAEAIKNTREKSGLTQSVFAALLGVSLIKTVETWETGKDSPSDLVKKIISIIQTDPEFIKKYHLIDYS